MLKHSQFNHIVKVPGEEQWAVANFKSGSVIKLTEFQKFLFDMADCFSENLPIVSAWKQAGFLTDRDEAEDFRNQIDRLFESRLKGEEKGSLRLKLYTTSVCNFACPYCFQHRRTGAMSRKVQDAVVRFAKDQLKTGRFNCLDIGWYGGEPLLEPEIIVSLSQRLMALASDYHVDYKADITTNAYLLDQDMIDMLERYKVSAAYVTLDGIDGIHDQTRHLTGGQPTFQRIVHNLRSIRTDIFISLRCNLHKGNLHCLGQLCSLAERIADETGNNIRLIPERMINTPAAAGRNNPFIPVSHEELTEAITLSGYSIKKDAFSLKSTACSAINPFGFQIDDEGDIFPDCNFMGTEKKYALGSIMNHETEDWKKIEDASFAHAYRWAFPRESEKCLTCKLLIYCCGGCPALFELEGERHCRERLGDPDAYVLHRLCIDQNTD